MSNIKLARRVTDIKVSPSTAAAQKARDLKAQGRDIVDLTVGEPDFDTPDAIKQAAIDAIEAGDTKYTPVNGTLALRNAIQHDYAIRLGIDAPLDQICVGGGAKQILFLALMATVEAGDEVIIPAPYWVSYPDMVIANGGTPVIVACGEEQRFKLTPAALEAAITPATRWLVLNAPSNPTGVAYTADELRALGDALLRHPQVMVLCDEIYDRIWYADFPVRSIASVVPDLQDRALIVNGVSKSYAMTGWRVGYASGPKELIAAINKLQSQSSSCPSSISQAAAAAALTGDQTSVDQTVAVYRDRCERIWSRLNAIDGLSCVKPDGAFYLYPNCAYTGRIRSNQHFPHQTERSGRTVTLESVGVASIHGAAYGMEPHFRISTATSLEVLEDGCNRIAQACEALR